MDDRIDGERLKSTAASIKRDVLSIQSKVKSQDVIIKSVSAEIDRGAQMVEESTVLLGRTIEKINKDPRNFIILVLALINIGLVIYFFSF